MNPISGSVMRLDQELADSFKNFTDVVLSPFVLTSWAIDKLKNLPIGEENEIHNETPAPVIAALQVIESFKIYHKRIFKSTSEWAMDIKTATEYFAMLLLKPLGFCKIGQELRTVISEKILGNLAQAVSFCAFQFFHAIPYLLVMGLFAGTHLIYKKAPVGLITFFAGSMLMIQVYLIFQLVKGIDTANKTLEEMSRKANIFESVYNIFIQTGKFIKGGASVVDSCIPGFLKNRQVTYNQ